MEIVFMVRDFLIIFERIMEFGTRQVPAKGVLLEGKPLRKMLCLFRNTLRKSDTFREPKSTNILPQKMPLT